MAVPLIFELAFVAKFSQLLEQVEKERQQESEARELQVRVNRVLKLLLSMGGRMGAYAFTQGGEYVDQYRADDIEIKKELKALDGITIDKPEAHAYLQKIVTTAQKGIFDLKDVKTLVDSGERENAINNLKAAKSLIKTLSFEADGFLNMYGTIEKVQADNQAQNRAQIRNLLSYFIAFNVLAAIALALYFTKGTTDRLKVLMENTHRLASGEPLKPPVSGSDEIAELDDVFRQMAKALAESEAHKQELIAIVTHELRSPLTSVQGVLTLIGTGTYGYLNEAGEEKLEVADRSITRLIDLINDLLDIEKMKTGKLEIVPVPISISDVLKRSTDSMRTLAAQKQITIEVQDCGVQVMGDRDRLVQVLINLISNAIKFSPEKSVIVVSSTETAGAVEVRVIDQGPGIPDKYKGAIFERFEQLENDTKDKRGTGLGLAICKAIVEQHGGSIGVASDDGNGSSFWFRIPKP